MDADRFGSRSGSESDSDGSYDTYLKYLQAAAGGRESSSEETEEADVADVGDADDAGEGSYDGDSDEFVPQTGEEIHIVLKEENRVTPDILTKTEMASLVSARASSIERHNDSMVPAGILSDPISIAKKELMMRRCPLCVYRRVGRWITPAGVVEHAYEIIDPNDPRIIFETHYPDVL